MSLLRVPVSDLAPGERVLDRDTARYVAHVRRLGAEASFLAFDPEARLEADGRVVAVGRDVRVALGPPRPSTALPLRRVTLVQCVGKGDKLDQVVRDATELGAARVLAAVAERSEARRDTRAAAERLRRVAVQAARQAGRGDVPELGAPRPLLDLLGEITSGTRVVLHPGATEALGPLLARTAGELTVVIGPEGGFSPAELDGAHTLGFTAARLGQFTMRTETAAAAALGAALAALEGLTESA